MSGTGARDAGGAPSAPRAAWGTWAFAAAAAVAMGLWMRGPVFGAAAWAPSTCTLRRTFGLACPTCGVTRAFALLARGEWRASLTLHPWALLIAVQLAALWVAWGAWLAGALRARPDRWVPLAFALNAAGLALLWLARFLSGTLPA